MTLNLSMADLQSLDLIKSRSIAPPIVKDDGPVVIFIGGIHGNEPAGIVALKQLLLELQEQRAFIAGSVYGLIGNKTALKTGQRYCEVDLNRIWSKGEIAALSQQDALNSEQKEQLELWHALQNIVDQHKGPFYFMDLHTTSGPTAPFLTVNDSLLNRRFTQHYPLPVVLGIEEYLQGPLLSYINELGYVAFGFEAGQHDDPLSIQNCYDFARLSLEIIGLMADGSEQEQRLRLGRQCSDLEQFYEIIHRHQVQRREAFKLNPGYRNFQQVPSGTLLGYDGDQAMVLDQKGQLFMPLYQGQGEDGYFLIRSVPAFFLGLSKILRKLRVDKVFPLLPGVHWMTEDKSKLRIDLKIARFFTTEVLHLFGYRKKERSAEELIVTNREAASKHDAYKKATWY